MMAMVNERSGRVSVGQVIARGLRARCPNCGGATLFSGWLKTHEACAACGLKFERDEGFFLGAMVINYALTGLLLIPIMIAAIVHALSVPVAMILSAAVAVLFPFLFYRAAKTLWLMSWYAVFNNDLPANRSTTAD